LEASRNAFIDLNQRAAVAIGALLGFIVMNFTDMLA
jgi:hypothetical protein